MKVKISIPVILQDGNEATISIQGVLNAPILGTCNGKAVIKTIDTPTIELMED